MFFLSKELKKGLEAARMILCTSSCRFSSETKVTSAKSSSPRNALNVALMLFSYSFHFKQNFSLSGSLEDSMLSENRICIG